ncbi:LacI family DNA-binding transcriptional regulator [Isoptericola dokdonensis]|uniref:HTH-type transcriptional repressor CytR n=1 Tax=Isoptericola dokdonensis DS-3 TaxID=1300344 RepID=A0A161IFP8_9MICO|nr:LacI family DNA-binding transcriptional regulator [Isoptericola dokdonensis]ANC32337.1 HTH-type transcriptional repressor CytR [Isoptericola dokdonensis DS-3]
MSTAADQPAAQPYTGRVTISDVARVAGVSVATVSKVVNNRYGVASATAERVLGVVADLGYESSLVARSLRRQSTNVVGVLVAEFEPYSTELLKGISSAVAGTGYELLAYSGGSDGGTVTGWERRSLSRLAGTLIDAAIVVTPTMVLSEANGIPVVAVDPHTGPEGTHTVDSDNTTGAREAVEHLVALGHRRIAHLGGRTDLESARLRELGYRQALDGAGIGVDPALVRVGGYRPETADTPARELLRPTRGERPTAVFAANDQSAIHVLEVAAELGLRVPEDLSVVGFDNIPESATTSPPLTTVAQPLHRMGAEALRMLLDVLEGTPREQHLRLPTSLVVRASTGPAPA